MALISTTAPTGASGGTSQSVLPDWYTNYAQQLLANQQAVSNTPYTTYQGPRVAGFNPTQQAGFEATKTAATSYAPGLQQATDLTGQQATRSALGASQPYFTEAAKSSTANIGDYMNPYIGNVVNRIGEVGARTLFENILPGISDRMIGAGGFGGTRQAELTGRGIREAIEGISAEQAKALSGGYSEALTTSAADLARRGQIGTNIADVYGRDTAAGLETARQMADLAAKNQALGLTGAEALTGVGTAQQDLAQKNYDVAYADFLRSQGYPQEQIDAMLKTLVSTKIAVPSATLDESYAPLNSSGTSGGTKTSALQDASTAIGVYKDLKEAFGWGK